MASYAEFLFARDGRICRKDFWLKFVLPLIGVNVVTSILDAVLFSPGTPGSFTNGPVSNVVSLALIWPQIVITAKRFHDRNMTGWWQIGFNVVIVGAALLAASQVSEGYSADNAPLVLTGFGAMLVAAIAELVILGFLPGTRGANKYGDDPLQPADALAESFA